MNFKEIKKTFLSFLITVTIVFLVIPSTFAANQNASALPPIFMLLLDEQEEIELSDASRFLTQATYGPTLNEISALTNSTYERWLDNQFSLAPTSHIEFGQNLGFFEREIPVPRASARVSVWVHVAMDAPDQLRQRMAFALSQIFVISDMPEEQHSTVTQYYDLLVNNAFGSYRELLEKITLNQDMGFFLGMAGNQKANAELNIVRPDENFAREIMQLFSIGLVELTLDGTPKLDDQGLQIPTYTQTHVEELAQVFSGWHMAYISPATFQNEGSATRSNYNLPMIPFPMYHDTTSKNLIEVPGFSPTLPANQTPEQDLEQALDRIANHPNVAPFISKQLIQRFVTSNPTPAYVRRIATVFNNTNGNLGAVLRALLLDNEARNGHINRPASFGKIKEPMLKLTGFWRGIGLLARTPFTGSNYVPIVNLGQIPLSAPSVFNFYPPDHSPPGLLANNGLLAPEALLLNDTSVIEMGAAFTDFSLLTSQNEDFRIPIATDHLEALVPDNLMRPADLIEHLNIVLLAGSMPNEMRTILLNMHSGSDSYRAANKLQVVNDILNIIALSPHFNVQR